MKVKKTFLNLLASFTLSALFISISYAGTKVLVKYSNYTYVKNEHAGGYARNYYGHLSVRGSERYNHIHYPKFAKINYKLKGKYHPYYVYSHSDHDTVPRKKTVKFRDSLSFRTPKTEAFGQIGLDRSNITINSVDGAIK